MPGVSRLDGDGSRYMSGVAGLVVVLENDLAERLLETSCGGKSFMSKRRTRRGRIVRGATPIKQN